MKNKKELDPKTEKKVEVISQVIVWSLAVVGLYFISVFAGWIEPIF